MADDELVISVTVSGEVEGGEQTSTASWADRVGDSARRRSKAPRHWAELTETERRDAVVGWGLPPYRGAQVSGHYFSRLEADPSVWSDLPAAARDQVCELFPRLLDLVTDRVADGGLTIKSLYALHDGSLVEAVLMRYPKAGAGARHVELGSESDDRQSRMVGTRAPRSTLCVSSQVGCGIGCPFCATGQAGLTRNLSAGEIIEQIRCAAAALESGALPGGAGHLNNIVYMGMGEPLANYRAVMTSIRAAVDGFGISGRGITVSTSGLVPRIDDLASEGLPVTLAVSLHAPDDDLRNDLVPLNRRWGVAEVLDHAKKYFDTTGRRVSIEYALMRDINDQAWRADRLAKELIARGRGWVHVNLIPLNPTPGSKWTASRRADEAEFLHRLETHRIPATIRDTRGQEIDGACGQLAAAGSAMSERLV